MARLLARWRNWPEGGEIDVIENVHDAPFNQMTLHTSEGCSLDTNLTTSSNVSGNYKRTEAFTSTILSTVCQSSPTYNDGCAFQSTDPSSYGHAFNNDRGGRLCNTSLIRRSLNLELPPGQTFPETYRRRSPTPRRGARPPRFGAQRPVIRLSTSRIYSSSSTSPYAVTGQARRTRVRGVPAHAPQAVADPSKFDFARWAVNYVAVYQSQ